MSGRPGWSPTQAPHRTRRADFPQRALQGASAPKAQSDREVKADRRRQAEPGLFTQVTPMRLAALTAPKQRPPPLTDHRRVDGVQLRGAVWQCKVLVEPAQHLAQPRLLVSHLPVHVTTEPIAGPVEEFPAALLTRPPDNRVSSLTIDPAHMLESEELERLGSFALGSKPLPGKAPEQE